MDPSGHPPAASKAFDTSLRFVRLRQVRADGFVEFDFAIGEPDLSVELIMPVAAFHEFCRDNQVTQLSPIAVAVAVSALAPTPPTSQDGPADP